MEYSIWDEGKAEHIPFWGNKRQLDELTELTTRCLKTLKETSSAREMVLETWLTIDFALRQFLISGFELYRFCDDNFDLRYILLPSSFRGLIDLFNETRNFCSKYPIESDSTPKDKQGGFRSSYDFLKYVRDEHADLWGKIDEVTWEYRMKVNPELREQIRNSAVFFSIPPENEVTILKPGWRKVAEILDDKWIDKAVRLNKARNAAAHRPDLEVIGKRLGLQGNNITELIRNECLGLLKTLLSVSA